MPDTILDALLSSVEARRPVALATVTAAPDPASIGRHAVVWLDAEPLGSLGLGELEAQALATMLQVEVELVVIELALEHLGPTLLLKIIFFLLNQPTI